MRNLVRRYHAIPRPVLQFIAAEQLLTQVNVVMMLTFNLVLRDLGHGDAFIGRIVSYRSLGTLLLALPVGLLLRGRRLRPLLVGAAVVVPCSTLVALSAATAGSVTLLSASVLLWGVGMMLMQVSNLPLIVRLTAPELATEAISLSFATFSVSMIASGVLVPAMSRLERVAVGPWTYELDEVGIIRVFAVLALAAVPMMWTISEGKPRSTTRGGLGQLVGDYDWGLIARAMAPTFAIAVGAGLTMPFVNLFFNAVFELSASQFSMLGGVTGVLVLLGSLANPAIRRRYGYRVAILLSQSLAVAFLIGLAMTELLNGRVPGMLWLAIVCYVLRQPLMNMAQPVSSELVMNYVGERNRELIAALHASIWSGSWFVSARIFRALRAASLPYWQIFLLTAGLYSVGIVLFARLIRAHERQVAPRE